MSPALERYQRIHLQAPSYRACAVCDHGGSCTPAAPCRHPETNNQRFPTVAAMRAPGGPCGPEAELQDFPGLRLR